MSPKPRSRSARLTVAAVLACASLVLAGCGGAHDGAAPASQPIPSSASSTASTTSAPTTSATRGPVAAATPGPAAGAAAPQPAEPASVPAPSSTAAAVPDALRPARITIPSIGVDSALVDLAIAGDGTIQVPTEAQQAGWLGTSPAPGQRGPAVIAGHVDSKTGPAVFYQLRTLAVGAPIIVTRRDGSQVTFTVDGSQNFAKAGFPTQATYGPVPGPALRLITCGGEYVKSAGGYQDNLVVFAS
ncbi:class F sortase [Lapillicoccus sp.]|uniref:class F sortase n=1 Tax=Lapillicoccus sp. TaxID=1909287 RepID=UPI003263A669